MQSPILYQGRKHLPVRSRSSGAGRRMPARMNQKNRVVTFFDSNGIYRGYKRDPYERGIREPFIVRWAGKERCRFDQ